MMYEGVLKSVEYLFNNQTIICGRFWQLSPLILEINHSSIIIGYFTLL